MMPPSTPDRRRKPAAPSGTSFNRGRRLAAALLLTLAATAAHGQAQVRVVDDRETEIFLARPAERIVSLTPHLTENLFAIGAGGRLVGVTTFSNHPPAARQIEIIGTYVDFDIERILELEPDVVVGWISGNPTEPVRKIERLGIPVYLTEPRSPEDVASELLRLGRLTGLSDNAERVAHRFLERIDGIRERYSHRDEVGVFYEVWNDPLMTLNGEHLVSKLLEGCGGFNVFSDLEALAPTVGVESVLDRNPEVIIAGGMGEHRPQWLDEWGRYPFLLAVERNNLFHVHPDLVHRHTTRLADGMEALCGFIEAARRKRP